ncbi:MAG TPA: DEAD/DEAH box helicase [Tepidisphaeraceae bacterium]|nr:DEAD/DEAH box helicase [Tepidisphaeraceae bacterium]
MPTAHTKARKRRRRKPDAVSRTRKPPEMSLEEWQLRLRRQFGREQKFKLANLGEHPVFSEFHVTNPQSKGTYRVAIRGQNPGDNFCSCPDFATNSLGTCKHIEFTLAKLRRQPGNSESLRRGFAPSRSEIYLRYGAQRKVQLRLGSDCPPKLADLSARYFEPGGLLKADAFGRFEEFLAAAGQADHELQCFSDAVAFVAEVRDGQRRRELVDQAFTDGIRSPKFDKLLKVPMYDYQRQGALFAATAGRCLIGDEMGLGKTVQAIAAVEIMAELLGIERVLIICPTSLKHQWEREIAKFCNRASHVVAGQRARRQQDYAAESFYKIANYDTIHADLDLIANWSPDLVILDEAQRIKNWNTRAARSVKAITSPYAIVLTGTPLENRLEELVSIVQFVDQHRLGPTFRFLADHQIHDDETGRVIGYKNLDTIGQALAPILIRRSKKQVLTQLPERIEKHLFVPMTDPQMQHHTENREIVAKIVAKWRRHHFLSEADQRRLMIALQYMRMSCDSTYLLDRETDFGVKADDLATLLGEILEQPDSKVVIFSQWLGMHEVLLRRFRQQPWEHVLFHGGVPGHKRKELVDRFREDQNCRAFLSTDAGGVGLNLQHANVVVNVDLPWNPAVLEQRIGRVHRLGQRQPVQVINFVSQGTIEEGMLSVLKFKKSLFAGALDGGEKEIFLGGSRLNRFMETVEKTASSIPTPSAQDPAPEPAGPGPAPEESTPTEARATPPRSGGIPPVPSDSSVSANTPWPALLQSGLAILEQLAAVAGAAPRRGEADGSFPPAPAGATPLVQRDPRTGQSYVKFPLPDSEVMDRLLGAVGTLLERFAPKR